MEGRSLLSDCDVDRIRSRAYLHRHKCHVKDFKYQGPNEVKHLLDRLDPLCIDMDNERTRSWYLQVEASHHLR